MSKLIFKIDGMCCFEETAVIKRALVPLLAGKEDRVTFDLISEKIIIEQDKDLPTENAIVKAVASTGMKATPWKIYVGKKQPKQTVWQQHGQAIMAAVSALGLGAGFLAHSIEDSASEAALSDGKNGNTYPPEVIAFYAVSMLSGIWFTLPKAFRSAWKLRPDMNLLMTIAVVGAASINQLFEAATAGSLFSASLLLESWNVNRARKSIRALVELSPLTAKVVEKRISNGTTTNKTYRRHQVVGDGNCGYSTFEVSREHALHQLIESVPNIKNILKPAVQEALLLQNFYDYLIVNKTLVNDIPHHDVIENIEKYATDIDIVECYLNYDVRDKHIDAGWAHPCVLQALGHIQKKEVRIWRLNEDDILIPHRGNEYDYTVYIPTNAEEQIDVLFVNGNHFEKLEFCENEDAIESIAASTSEYEMTQSIFIDKMVDEIPVGSIIIVKPGEKIPMDSVLISGPTEVNQAPITGESMPVRKEIGDELFAGTINGDAVILCRVTKLASDSTLSRIINMIEAAQSRRASSEQFVEKFASYYTPLMMLLASVMMIVLPTAFDHSWEEAFYQALEILVISCPCALVVSTPISIVAGLNAAAREGVLIKGGMYLEAPAHLKAIALDKTGTLTSGEPTVQKIITMDKQSKNDLLKLALALEEHSDHPLARAIRQKATSEGIVSEKPVENFHIFKGKGAEGYLDGKLFWIGSRRLLREKVGDLAPIAIYNEIQNLENSGHSVVAIGYDQHVCGLIGISDLVRPESKEAIQELQQLGIEKIIMLTGDNRGSAKAIAGLIGIDDYQAELLPENKVEHVESLVKKYKQVAMVGDGVNDAPAMATANLAIAMGAAGSDAAIETADIALMADDLRKLAWLISHSRRTLRIIKQNVVISLSIKALFMGLALANKATLGMAIAADMGASFIVVFNALRLLNNGLSLRSLGRDKKNSKTSDYGLSHNISYNDKRPLLLEQKIEEIDEIELTVIDEKSISIETAKATPALNKTCCSSDGGCAKPKPVSASLNNKPSLLVQDIGASTSDKAELTIVGGKNSLLEETKANTAPKKACCSGDGGCSKPKLPVSAPSNEPSLLVMQDIRDSTSSKTELTAVGEKSMSFEETKTNSVTKKPCCSSIGGCSKPKLPVSAPSNQPLLLVAQEVGDLTSHKTEFTVVGGKNSLFEEAEANLVPKKACCRSGSCSKPKQLEPVPSIAPALILKQDASDSNKVTLKFT